MHQQGCKCHSRSVYDTELLHNYMVTHTLPTYVTSGSRLRNKILYLLFIVLSIL